MSTDQGLSWQSNMSLAYNGEFEMSLCIPCHLGGMARWSLRPGWGCHTGPDTADTPTGQNLCEARG